MKAFFKFTFGLILSIVLIGLSFIVAAGAIYFTLPVPDYVSSFILKYVSDTVIFWVTIGSAISFVIFSLVQRILTKKWHSKIRNFIIRLCGWIICIVAVVLSLTLFILTDPLTSTSIDITIAKKIGIGTLLTFLIIYHVLARKISVKINRRLQSHDVAKEIGAVGRSNIVWNNIIRLFEVFFPEVILLIAICLMTSWNVASYFIVCLLACIFPFIGNIEADYNIRNEARRSKEKEHDKLVNDIANKVTENNGQ